MKIQHGAQVPTGSACPNNAKHYLFTLAPAGADLLLMIVIEALLCL